MQGIRDTVKKIILLLKYFFQMIFYKQYTELLGKKHFSRLQVVESGQQIKDVRGIKDIFLANTIEEAFFVREDVFDMLVKAMSLLPKGNNLYFICGFRSIETQRRDWDNKFEQMKKIYSEKLSNKQIIEKTNLLVANPDIYRAPHITGGSVDVRLCADDGKILDMGRMSNLSSEKDFQSIKMFSPVISDVQKKNRKILRNAMTKAGFSFYPGEWWHYSYGNRDWAAYSFKRKCFFGPIYLTSNNELRFYETRER